MIRSTRSVSLVLASCSLAALGFGLWEHGPRHSSTQPANSSHSSFWTSHSGWSSGSSFSSGTSRGGFGSTGHSVSS